MDARLGKAKEDISNDSTGSIIEVDVSGNELGSAFDAYNAGDDVSEDDLVVFSVDSCLNYFFFMPSCPVACPCGTPGDGGTVTISFSPGGIFCDLVGISGSWVYMGDCVWTSTVGGGTTCTYNPSTNQFDIVPLGGVVVPMESFSVPAVCDATGTYPVFSQSGLDAGVVCGTYTITSV